MKYIRTKDGHIFEVEKDLGRYGISKAVIICDFDGNFIDVEKQNMILKQADTIEELCDEIVFDLGNHYIPYTSPYQYNAKEAIDWFKTVKEIDLGFGFMVKIEEKFLAIWTKGEHDELILKSVAKMNESGCLQLL